MSVAGTGKSASKPVSEYIYDDYFFYAITIPLHFGFRFREYLLDITDNILVTPKHVKSIFETIYTTALKYLNSAACKIKSRNRVRLPTTDNDGPSCERTDRTVDSGVLTAVADENISHRLSSYLQQQQH